MKNVLLLIAFTCCVRVLPAQIGLGITTPHPNAYFQVNSTTRGVLLPRMSAVQRIAIAPAPTANGLIVYDTDSSAYMFWTGTAWKKMGGDDGNWIKNGSDIYNRNIGRVGIGTNTPLARLHVADSSVLFSANVFDPFAVFTPPPAEGSGVRMMWYPQKAAFRAGLVDDGTIFSVPGLYDNKVWDKDSIGLYTFAAGFNTKAKGEADVVLGMFNESSGGASALFGVGNKSYGQAAFSSGMNNIAYGNYNTVLGESNITSGSISVAIGKSNVALDSSIVIGTGNLTQTQVLGGYANISLGNYNESLFGFYTTTIGFANKTGNSYSFAAGYKSAAFERGAIAIGVESYTDGEYALAMGYNTIAHARGCVSVGMLNDGNDVPANDATDRIFQIGNGTDMFGVDNLYRSNAMTVLRSGNVGIGTVTPSATLHVAGGFKFENGTEGPGKVLTSGMLGEATWTDLPANFWTANGTSIYNNNPGNVGIGVSNPVSPLSFASNTGNKISLWGNDPNQHYGLGVQGSLLQLYVPTAADNIAFGTGASNNFTERVRIQGNGYVGIGDNNPAYILDVNGRMRIRSGGSNPSSAGVWLNNNANTSSPGFVGMESDGAIGFYGDVTPNGWGLVMNIATGNVGIGTSAPTQKLHVIGNILATGTITPSDIRYKTNITAIQNPLSKLLAINGVNYLMNRAAYPEWQFDSTLQYGLIAQEVEKVFPEMVKIISRDGYKGIDYVKLVPVLVEALRELHAGNKKLEEENKEVKEQLRIMDQKISRILRKGKLEK